MAGIVSMIGAAVINAVAFSGSSAVFGSLRENKTAEEQKRHDIAMEKYTVAHQIYEKRRERALDWINDKLRKQNKATKDFNQVDEAMRAYYNLMSDPKTPSIPYDILNGLQAKEPRASDFYDDDKKQEELIFVFVGVALVTFLAYKYI